MTEQGEWELRRDATIGQITMLTASSFCGPYGALWGYDVARSSSWPPPAECSRPKDWDQCDPERRERILTGGLTGVWGRALFDAAEYLFGHNNDNYWHPPLPGYMVTCANQEPRVCRGPTTYTGETSAVRGSDKSKVKVEK